MIELIVSILIVSILASTGLFFMSNQRSYQMVNQCAQVLAADLRRAEHESLRGETYTYFTFTTGGYIVYRIPEKYSWIPSNWKILQNRDFSTEYGRVSFTVGGNTTLAIGPNGWPMTNNNASTVSGGVITSSITATPLNDSNNLGTYYMWTLGAGTQRGVPPTQIKLYSNGHVSVVTLSQ